MPNRERGDWWDRSWTIVSGCSWPDGERPPECDHCYAVPMCERFDAIHSGYGEEFHEVRTHPGRLDWLKPTGKALTWLCSIAGDLFHPDVPDEFIREAIRKIHLDDGHHRVAVLTKRYERGAGFFTKGWDAAQYKLPGMILMFSAGTQANVDRACLAAAKLPPTVLWGLHLEPLLEAVTLPIDECLSPEDCYEMSERCKWIVVGGETFPDVVKPSYCEHPLRHS